MALPWYKDSWQKVTFINQSTCLIGQINFSHDFTTLSYDLAGILAKEMQVLSLMIVSFHQPEIVEFVTTQV